MSNINMPWSPSNTYIYIYVWPDRISSSFFHVIFVSFTKKWKKSYPTLSDALAPRIPFVWRVHPNLSDAIRRPSDGRCTWSSGAIRRYPTHWPLGFLLFGGSTLVYPMPSDAHPTEAMYRKKYVQFWNFIKPYVYISQIQVSQAHPPQ